ncbi:MAG: hypothetical protein ACUZ8H_00435 [Candidatus Anammoxibacter sp.]
MAITGNSPLKNIADALKCIFKLSVFFEETSIDKIQEPIKV